MDSINKIHQENEKSMDLFPILIALIVGFVLFGKKLL